MASVSVQDRTATIDGNLVKYKRLVIGAYVNGEPFTLELKINATEATMAKMLLASNENYDVTVKSGGNVDIEKTTSDETLDDIFEN